MYKKLPLVYSLVYYNGEKKWRYPLDIKALIDAPADLVQQYALQPFQLIELNKISDDILRQHIWSGILSLTMKHIYDRDILPVLKSMMTAPQDLEKRGAHEFVESLLYYIYYVRGEISDNEAFQSLFVLTLNHL